MYEEHVTSVFLNLIFAPGHHLKMVKGRVQILHSLPGWKVWVQMKFLKSLWIFFPKRVLQILTVFLLCHPDVRIVTEASLAEDWEVCILPVGPVVRVGRQGHRHPGIWFSLWKKECFSLQCSFSPSFVMIQFWNIYCFSKNLCILDITWRTHYKEQIGHNLYVEIEKMPLNLSSCDQSSPFSSPSPFFSGDALPLFDSWDFDLREKLSDFLFQGKQLFTMLGDLICQAPWSPWISILLHGWARPRLGVTLGLKCLKFEGAFMFKWE